MPEEESEKLREKEKLDRGTMSLFLVLWLGGLLFFASMARTWFPDDVAWAWLIGPWVITFAAYWIAKNI